MSNQESPGGVSRRALLKSTALGSLALAAGGLTLPFTLRRAAAAVQQATGDTTRIVWGACSVNCGSRCALRLHVRGPAVQCRQRPYDQVRWLSRACRRGEKADLRRVLPAAGVGFRADCRTAR